MEEQLDIEANRLKDVPAKGENRKRAKKFTLQLVAMIVQWLVLLACVISIGLCYHKNLQPQWVYVKLNISMKPIDIKKEEGTMNISKQSIQVRCDGHYLFFLKGTIILQPSNSSLMLSVKKKREKQMKELLKVDFRANKTEVQEAMLTQLHAQDEISIEANRSATSKELSLILIMLTPQSYCFPEN